MAGSRLSAALTLSDNTGARASNSRMRLLELIGIHGSISAAAKSAGISYKAAWDAVDALNNLFHRPLVTTQSGGRTGGGAQLTDDGRQVIAAFSALHGELDRFLEALSRSLGGNPSGIDPSTLIWSVLVRTSARNMLRGTVVSVTPGAVNAEISLRVSDEVDIVAMITNKSLVDLGLAPGGEAFALIKASFVMLAPEGEALRTSARNRIAGVVAAHTPGAVNDEFVLDIGCGRTIVAIVSSESARMLDFKPGDRVAALFDPAHVILAVG